MQEKGTHENNLFLLEDDEAIVVVVLISEQFFISVPKRLLKIEYMNVYKLTFQELWWRFVRGEAHGWYSKMQEGKNGLWVSSLSGNNR